MTDIPYSILHISDLHRSPLDSISNDELVSALLQDRERYVEEDPSIQSPQAIIVSGDIIQGVPLHTVDFRSRIENQYEIAEDLLTQLVRRFLDGDRSRLIMVPGNHDVDWNTAFTALETITTDEIPPDLRDELHSEDSLYRWDWNNRTLYRIADPDRYEMRFDAYSRFSERFYSGVGTLPAIVEPHDPRIFHLFDDRIGIAAYNSCFRNDCFAYHGMIQRSSVARADLALTDSGELYDLRMAVWHHNIDGSPYKTDYMNVDIVRGMIGRGFRLGLHGHQHKSQVTAQEIRLPGRERMAIVSAGSLCASGNNLPVGTSRQYNILEISGDCCSVRTHVRSMAVANLFSPARLTEFGGHSYFDLKWDAPTNAVGLPIDYQSLRQDGLIQKAETAAKTGQPDRAMALLRSLPLIPNSYQRQLYLTIAEDVDNWPGIVEVLNTPTSIPELILRIEALCRLDDAGRAIDSLNRFSTQLHLPDSIVSELRTRIKVQEAMKQ